MRKNPLEWTVFAVSLALVGALAVLLVRGHTGDEAAPRLAVTTEPSPGGSVEVSVRNDGTAAAADVDVEVRRGPATATLTFDFVPRRAVRTGTVVFADSARGDATARIVGFVDP